MYLKTFNDMKKTSTFFMLKPTNAIYGFIITICTSIITILFWAVFAPIDDVIKVQVLLRPNKVISSVKCVASGQLYSKNFINNQNVQKGDLLFTLDTNAYKSELNSYNNQLKKIENNITIAENLLKVIKNESEVNIITNQEILITVNNYLLEKQKYEYNIQQAQINLDREKTQPEMLLIKQIIEDKEFLLEQSKNSLKNWQNNQLYTTLENLKNLKTTKESIQTHITELERTIKNSTIYAPISGRIIETTELNIFDYIFAGEEVLRIVPQNNEKLKANIYVDPKYIARVNVGNPVKIKFLGLPPSRYGMIETEILTIPPDVTYINNTAVFIVEAEIESPYLSTKNGKIVTLIPGISAEGRIVTERTTVMQMVLRKLDFIN